MQVTWVARSWDYYTLLWAWSWLQGDQEKLWGAEAEIDDSLAHELEEEGLNLGLDDAQDGPRLLTAFAKFSPNLGYLTAALQIGLWGAWSDSRHQEFKSTRRAGPWRRAPAREEEEHMRRCTPWTGTPGCGAWMPGLQIRCRGRSYGAGSFKSRANTCGLKRIMGSASNLP